jgi:cytochrome c oxidase subunit 4
MGRSEKVDDMSEHVLAGAVEQGNPPDGHVGHHEHVSTPTLLIGIFAALIVLTLITVYVAGIDFGAFNIWMAMGVATVKATLVGLYFMHLRYDSKFNTFIFLASFFFVSLFVGFTMMDSSQYQNVIQARVQKDRDAKR